MNRTEIEKIALEVGVESAKAVLAFRDNANMQRINNLTQQPGAFRSRTEMLSGQPLNSKLENSFTFTEAASKGVVIAEGDSWFYYPFHDILKCLENIHGYDVESVAHWGDPIEEMAYASGQLEELTRLVEKTLRRGVIPKAILLSGGGNDVAGEQFGMLLNHAQSKLPPLSQEIVNGIINERVRSAYITILKAVTEVCITRLEKPIPILVHGYDYPVPDGRGFLGGFGKLPGPWFDPGFRQKGYPDTNMQKRLTITKEIIDKFNTMLIEVSEMKEFARHVKYINLRGFLSINLNNEEYQDWWDNELHPNDIGFNKISDRFAEVLESL